MRPVVILLATLLTLVYVIGDRLGFFDYVANSPAAKHPIYSETLDIKKPGHLTWTPKAEWMKGSQKAQLSLAVNPALLWELPFDRSQGAKRCQFILRADTVS